MGIRCRWELHCIAGCRGWKNNYWQHRWHALLPGSSEFHNRTQEIVPRESSRARIARHFLDDRKTSSMSTGTSKTEVGSYFISNYPPFSAWSPEQVPAIRKAVNAPPAGSQLGLYLHI